MLGVPAELWLVTTLVGASALGVIARFRANPCYFGESRNWYIVSEKSSTLVRVEDWNWDTATHSPAGEIRAWQRPFIDGGLIPRRIIAYDVDVYLNDHDAGLAGVELQPWLDVLREKHDLPLGDALDAVTFADERAQWDWQWEERLANIGWVPAAGLAIMCMFWVTSIEGNRREQRRVRERLATMQCPACRYDISHSLSARCPECGESLSEFR